jgi:hypothetical protein
MRNVSILDQEASKEQGDVWSGVYVKYWHLH